VLLEEALELLVEVILIPALLPLELLPPQLCLLQLTPPLLGYVMVLGLGGVSDAGLEALYLLLELSLLLFHDELLPPHDLLVFLHQSAVLVSVYAAL